jgi:hypothetical protein
MTRPKESVTAEELYVLLDREFRRRASRECRVCYIQLPYRVDPANEGPNWEVLMPPGCERGCTDVMEEIICALRERFLLAPQR